MKTNVTIVRILQADRACKRAVELEWGSPEQIEAEKYFYELMRRVGFDADSDADFIRYADKATTEEAMYYAMERAFG